MPVTFHLEVEEGKETNSSTPDDTDDAKATPRERPKLTKSVVMTPEKNVMGFLLKLYIFIEAFTSKGLNHFNNVYFVIILGWSPLKASWIWFARDCVRFVFQTLLSSHIDATEDKKKILYLIALQKLFAGIVMVTTTNFVAQLVKGASDGFTAVAIWPCVTAMTLGVMGKTRFHKKHASVNLMVQYVGTFLSVLLFGCIAYVLYPKLQNIFYQNIVIAVLLFFTTLLMPSESETVNSQIAKGNSVRQLLQRNSYIKMASEYFTDYGSDDDEEEKLVKDDKFDDDGQKCVAPSKKSDTMSIRQMYADPGRGRSLIFLSVVYFGFHLVNATALPLFGQYINLSTDNKATLPAFTGILFIIKFNCFITTWFLKGRLEKIGYRNALFLGCFFLAARLLAIVIIGTFTENVWALGATTLLHGPGDAIMNLTKTLYSHLLSRKTGRFNLNMGIVSTFETIGSALSILIGGALATSVGYHTTFVILTIMIIFPVCCIFGIDNVALLKW